MIILIFLAILLLVIFLQSPKQFIGMVKDYKSGKMSAKELVSFVLFLLVVVALAIGMAYSD